MPSREAPGVIQAKPGKGTCESIGIRSFGFRPIVITLTSMNILGLHLTLAEKSALSNE